MEQQSVKNIVCIEEINKKNSENVSKLIERGENAYKEQITKIANEIKSLNKKIVLISGPSSAGKTTSGDKICFELKTLDINAKVLNMDDFFKDLDTVPFNEKGVPDMEGIVALDVDCVVRCLKELLNFGKSMVPEFDFKTHKRKKDWKEFCVEKDEVIIMEGIHALNPLISNGLDKEKLYKVYVFCNTDFYFNDEILFESRDLRLLRRIVRDKLYRHAPIEETLSLWEAVCEGEDKNIIPFRHLANFYLNTAHFYEPLLYKRVLSEEFEELRKNGFIRPIIEKFKVVSSIEPIFIPEDSLVREFIGEKKD